MLTFKILDRLRALVTILAGFVAVVPLVHAASRPIPEIVNAKIFAKADDTQLELLLRVPLTAVKDVQFPTQADGDTLDLVALQTMLPGAAKYWIADTLVVTDAGNVVPAPQIADSRVAISADRSFDSYATAQSHFASPLLAPTEEVFWRQVWFDIRLTYPLNAGKAHRIAIEPKLADLGVRVNGELTHVSAEDSAWTYTFDGNHGKIYLDPRWTDVTKQFAAWGATLIVSSADFLLLLISLALPFRRYREFLPSTITFASAFILAVAVASFGWVPNSVAFKLLIETLATIAILFTAFANIAGRVTMRRRALLAMAAGAIFGFLAFASLHDDLQFSVDRSFTATLSFGMGAMLAMAFVTALCIPIATSLFVLARAERIERIIVSALVAETVWRWFSDRSSQLARASYQIEWDRSLLGPTLKWLAVALFVFGIFWLVDSWLKSFCGEPKSDATTARALEPT